jgi:hypothetical protein
VNELDVILAVKPVGFVGDVKVVVLTEVDGLEPVELVAIIARV